MNQRPKTSILMNQSGQGITEYILVLFVIVMMILGGMYQLNTAFEKWAHNYFGEYLACLLETGELPAIGGAPGDSGICNELFNPFDLANGRTKKLAEGGNGGGGGGSDNPRGGSGSGGGVRETGSSRGRSSFAGSRGAYGNSGGFNSSKNSRAAASNKKSKSKYTGSTDSSLPSGAGYNNSRNRMGRERYVSVNGRRIVDTEERGTESRQAGKASQRDPTGATKQNAIHVNKSDSGKDQKQQDDEPWTFGSFLRFLIIAAIVIALVLFLGGQALQISKGSE